MAFQRARVQRCIATEKRGKERFLKKQQELKGLSKAMLRLAQHDKGTERKISIFVIPSKVEGSLQKIE